MPKRNQPRQRERNRTSKIIATVNVYRIQHENDIGIERAHEVKHAAVKHIHHVNEVQNTNITTYERCNATRHTKFSTITQYRFNCIRPNVFLSVHV